MGLGVTIRVTVGAETFPGRNNLLVINLRIGLGLGVRVSVRTTNLHI